jgi:hypothetical protein
VRAERLALLLRLDDGSLRSLRAFTCFPGSPSVHECARADGVDVGRTDALHDSEVSDGKTLAAQAARS